MARQGFREIVKVLDKVRIRSFRGMAQATELDQVAELYGVCAQDNETLRFRAAKVSKLRVSSRGGSLYPVIFKVSSLPPRSVPSRCTDRSRFTMEMERGGVESGIASGKASIAPNK